MPFRVLLADDLYFMRMVQKEVLEANGYQIVGEASTGTEAVAKYQELNPDIIICSAIGQQSLIVDAINAGIKDFIVKPFKPERLLSAIKNALAA